MPQYQYYPTNNQQYQQPLLPISANYDMALCGGQITQSISGALSNITNCL